MKRMMVLLLLAGAAVAIGCSDLVQGPCTPDRRLGLAILVVNDQSGTHLCDATVTARDGAYSETLQRTSDARVSSCLYVGAAERAGTYSVRAEAVGFTPSTVSDLRVATTEDGCHVERVQRTIGLVATQPR
jgi:hypothetical protein